MSRFRVIVGNTLLTCRTHSECATNDLNHCEWHTIYSKCFFCFTIFLNPFCFFSSSILFKLLSFFFISFFCSIIKLGKISLVTPQSLGELSIFTCSIHKVIAQHGLEVADNAVKIGTWHRLRLFSSWIVLPIVVKVLKCWFYLVFSFLGHLTRLDIDKNQVKEVFNLGCELVIVGKQHAIAVTTLAVGLVEDTVEFWLHLLTHPTESTFLVTRSREAVFASIE